MIKSPVNNMVPIFAKWFMKRVPELIKYRIFVPEPAVTAAKAMKINSINKLKSEL